MPATPIPTLCIGTGFGNSVCPLVWAGPFANHCSIVSFYGRELILVSFLWQKLDFFFLWFYENVQSVLQQMRLQAYLSRIKTKM